MSDIIVRLKGSPVYSIDTNGLMAIRTTWILTPKVAPGEDNIKGWLNFESVVKEWAGEVGAKYKKPKPNASSREVTAYTNSSDFTVSDVSYNATEGRTAYEVTYTNTQTAETLTQVGNVSAQIDDNGEVTKSINYILDVESSDEIDTNFIDTGTIVQWAGSDYMVTGTTYTPETSTRYTINVTAKDMSYMKIGNTVYATDSSGRQTATATWRVSRKKFESWEFPKIGSDASLYIRNTTIETSEPPKDTYTGYIITSVSHEPIGCFGYMVSINAKKVTLRHVSTSAETTANGITYKVTYECPRSDIQTFSGIIGTDMEAFNAIVRPTGYAIPTGKIRNVSVTENGKYEYVVVLDTTTEPPSDVSISSSQGKFVLCAHMCGWATGESGEPYPINNPPDTQFSFKTTVAELKAKGFLDTELLTAIRTQSMIGYATVKQVTASDGKTQPRLLSNEERLNLKNLTGVSSITMSTYVYAQPTLPLLPPDGSTSTTEKMVVNKYFVPWKRSESLPMYFNADIDTGSHYEITVNNTALKLDKELSKKYIGKSIPVTEIVITIPYYTTMADAFSTDPEVYYANAIRRIGTSKRITSYKGTALSMAKAKDSAGKDIVNITCTFSALVGWYWNKKYEDHATAYIYNVSSNKQ